MEKEIERIMGEVNDWSIENLEELESQISVFIQALREDERNKSA